MALALSFIDYPSSPLFRIEGITQRQLAMLLLENPCITRAPFQYVQLRLFGHKECSSWCQIHHPSSQFYIHLNFGADHFVHTQSDEPIWPQAEGEGVKFVMYKIWIETMSLLGEKHMKCLPILKRAFIMQGVCFQFISLWHIWCWLASPSNPHDETWHCPFVMHSTSFLHSWFQSDNLHTYKTMAFIQDGTTLANYNLNSGVRTWEIANFTAEH